MLNLIKSNIGKLKNRIISFSADKEKKSSLLKKIITAFVAILIIATSGYSATEFYFSNKIVALLYISLFVFSFALFVINIPLLKIKRQNLLAFLKTISVKNIVILVVCLLFLVSCFFNVFKYDNINGTIKFLLTFFSSALLVATIPFKKFAKIYCISLVFICLVSIGILLINLTLGSDGASLFYFTDNNVIVSSYNYISFFVSSWYTYQNGLSTVIRLCGPFWEPSIFAALIIIGLVLTVLFNFKNKNFLYIIYISSLILTFSTGGYFVAILVFLLWLSIKIKDKNKRIISLSLISGIIVICIFLIFGPLLPYLIKYFPVVFSKLQTDSEIVRFISIPYLLNVFSKSPIFGFGINGARLQYVSLFSENATDLSLTSSYGMLIAAFGIPGLLVLIILIFSPLLTKYRNLSSNIMIVIIFLVLLNLENMLMISAVAIIMLYFFKEGIYGETCLSSKYSQSPKLISKIVNGSERGKANKSMLGLLLIKGIALVVGLFTVPVFNSFFVTDELYGTWSVIISVLSWTLLFDFGFGSGLRARLADAIDNNDEELKKKLISSTYFGSLLVGVIIFIISESLIFLINLNQVMGIPASVLDSNSLRISMSILAFGLCLEFVLKNIVFIHYAEKKTVLGSSYTLISNILLILIFIVGKDLFPTEKMIFASIIYLCSVNIPFIVGSLIFFSKKKNKYLIPSIRFFNFKTCKSVMSFGITFFLIQIGFLLIALTDSVFISNLYGPASAADYSKYYKIFSFFIGLMGAVVQQPIWSAVATSINKGHFDDIKKFTKTTLIISIVLFVFCLISALALQLIFDVWLGNNSIVVDSTIVIGFIIYSLIFLIADAFIIVANGLKILKVQAIITLVGGVMKIVFVIIVHFIPAIYSLGWSFLLIFDALCYLPFIICLPFSISKKIKKLKELEETTNEQI